MFQLPDKRGWIYPPHSSNWRAGKPYKTVVDTQRQGSMQRRRTWEKKQRAAGGIASNSLAGKLPGLSTDRQKPERSPWSLWGEKAESAAQRTEVTRADGKKDRKEAQGPAGASFQGFSSVLPQECRWGKARPTGRRRRVEQPLELTQGWEELTFPPACKGWAT